MSDGVTAIGAGWDIAVPGTAEAALRDIIAAGQLTGQAVADALIAAGYGERGPVYYPVEDGKGPFYALGKPHTYASIETIDGARVWNLTKAEDGALPIDVPPPSSDPAPVVVPNLDGLTLADISQRLADLESTAAQAQDLKIARDEIIAAIRESQDAIQQQIDQAIKNAEKSAAALIPIAEAAIPALGGLLGKV